LHTRNNDSSNNSHDAGDRSFSEDDLGDEMHEEEEDEDEDDEDIEVGEEEVPPPQPPPHEARLSRGEEALLAASGLLGHAHAPFPPMAHSSSSSRQQPERADVTVLAAKLGSNSRLYRPFVA
jgi:hypothetical protein